MDYKTYITSLQWRDKHKHFLKRSHYPCAFFPWVKVGKKHRYNCHHMNYENLGDETLWVDVIVVCPFAHKFILHGILSGFKRPSQQKSYPNAAQRCVSHSPVGESGQSALVGQLRIGRDSFFSRCNLLRKLF